MKGWSDCPHFFPKRTKFSHVAQNPPIPPTANIMTPAKLYIFFSFLFPSHLFFSFLFDRKKRGEKGFFLEG